MRDISIQLYSVRDALKEDYLGTLRKLAEIGYTGVEFIMDFYDNDPKDIRRVMDEVGLKASASHTNYKLLTPKNIETLKILGVDTIFEPSLPFFRYNEKTLDILINILRETKEFVNEQGFDFGYHNHAFEITNTVNLKPLLYQYKDNISDLKFEVDVFWVEKGGMDSIVLLNDFDGRLSHIHLKDIDRKTGKNVFTGTGDIDFKKVFEIADKNSCKWVTVEHEPKFKDNLKSLAELQVEGARECFNGLRGLL